MGKIISVLKLLLGVVGFYNRYLEIDDNFFQACQSGTRRQTQELLSLSYLQFRFGRRLKERTGSVFAPLGGVLQLPHGFLAMLHLLFHDGFQPIALGAPLPLLVRFWCSRVKKDGECQR